MPLVAVGALPAAAAWAVGQHRRKARRGQRVDAGALLLVAAAGDEHVGRDVAGEQCVGGAGGRDEHARGARRAGGGAVAAGQVDAVAGAEPLPRQRIVAVRDEPLAEHGDRALGGRVEMREGAALGTRAHRRLQVEAVRLAQLGGGAAGRARRRRAR